MGDDGRMNPSSFIPCCAYAGNMDILGQTIPQFSIPVCNQFKPQLMDGQMCFVMNVNYVMNMKNMKDHMGTKHGAQGGLSFVMDYNYLMNMGSTEDRNMEANFKCKWIRCFRGQG
jgi:hypothetical protein